MFNPESLDISQWEEIGRFVGERLNQIAELRAENASLREQLQSSSQTEPFRSRVQEVNSRGAPSDEYRRLGAKYEQLSRDYRKLQAENDRQSKAIRNGITKYKFLIRRCLEWQPCLERSGVPKDKFRFFEQLLDSSEAPFLPGTSDEFSRASDDTPARNKFPNSPSRGALPTPQEPGVSGLQEVNAPPREDSITDQRHVSSSQTTDINMASSPPSKKTESTSDGEPLIVSARSLKRKRGNSTRRNQSSVRIKQEPASPQQTLTISSNDESTPKPTRHQICSMETMDLDALNDHIETPHKQGRHRSGSEIWKSPTKASRCPNLFLQASSLSENDPPIAKSEPINAFLPKDDDLSKQSTLEYVGPVLDFATRRNNRSSRPLQPLSNNIAPISQARKWPVDHAAQRKSIERAFAVSEGGELESNSPDDEEAPKTTENDRRDRLRTLLDGVSPRTAIPPQRPTPRKTAQKRPSSRNERKSRFISDHGRQSSPAIKQEHIEAHPNIKPPPQRSPAHEKRPIPSPADRQALRLRPLSSLHLSDFIINPRYQGSSFAFADTIRGRDRRRCLPGCTKAECCGEFRRAAELGVAPQMSNKTDAELLEGHLGSDWNVIVGSYSPGKRKKVLVEARAAAFADQHGKHRSAFDRPSTPPGFWRTDMPTTQEELDDRVRAGQLERLKIEERWREALRENGRYKFRDE